MRTTILPLTAALLATGCSAGIGDELADVLPDDRIAVNMPVENSAAKDATGEEKQWSDLYLLTAEVTEDVNRLVHIVLYTVSTIAREVEPTEVDSENQIATWGPWGGDGLDPTEGQLVVQKLDDASYVWAIEMWPKNSPEDAVAVVEGEVDSGSTHDVNSGRFTIDFSSINTMDPTEEATGVFAVDYAVDMLTAQADASFENVGQGVDAAYRYEQAHGGAGFMDLQVEGDFEDAGSLTETLTIRSRWAPEGAGRSDAYAEGGDLGDFVGETTECWNSDFDMVYQTKNWNDAPDVGTVEECVFDEVEFPE